MIRILTRKPKTGQVSFSLQFRDCPWGKINELHEKGLEYDDESLKGIKKFNDKDVTYLLDKMGRVGMELVVGSIKDKMIEVSYRKPKPEPKVENNGPKISG